MLKVSVLSQKGVTLLPASFAGSRRGPFPTGRISKIGHKKEMARLDYTWIMYTLVESVFPIYF